MAIDAAIDFIDLKEPDAGPLAATDPGLWREVTRRWPGAAVSVALGERDTAAKLARAVPPSVRFAKAGPAGCGTLDQVAAMWRAVATGLGGVQLVAVGYADHLAAGCPPWHRIANAAAGLGIRRVLIDTFDKSAGCLLVHLDPGSLAAQIDQRRDRGLWTAVAGSLSQSTVRELTAAGVRPDCWAVRGAVCRKTRTAAIDASLLRRWRTFLTTPDRHEGSSLV